MDPLSKSERPNQLMALPKWPSTRKMPRVTFLIANILENVLAKMLMPNVNKFLISSEQNSIL